jgi:multicomponent Na+:H+ antiporter subunit B
MKRHTVLLVVSKGLIPFIFLFALYVQFHGDYSPGGGFQAGVIFAAGIVLYTLIFGLRPATDVIQPRVLETLIPLGVLLYAGTGLMGIIKGKHFLNYNVLAETPIGGQHVGLMFVEFGVGVTVTTVMVSIFFAFAGRKRIQPPTKE